MTASQWQQVRELFEAALAAEPVDLPKWLDAQAADAAVRQEVASLLDHHSRAGSFLVESVVDRVPSLLEEEEGALEDGASVGHYKIGRELGRGAMGRVYLATDTRLGRLVALKALAPHLTGDVSHRERLRREARAAASLTHSGICTVYALEEIDGQLFIASELVDGRTLRDEMARGSQPASDAIAATARDLAEALASAHAKGITHRDFKPENVMRGADGRLKVLDFGLALVDRPAGTPAAARATMPGTLVGTPAYMSPEQLNGQPADARSDVFAFGVVLYEYACGVHPFDAATPLGLAARVLESEAAPIAHRNPHVPAAVAAVVDRCLRKSPADRFASAGEIALALVRADGATTAPPRSTRFQTMWRVHQAATMALYFAAGMIAWWVKETAKAPLSLWMFVAIGLAGTVVGVMRGHLLFTWRMNRSRLTQEWRRVRPAVVAIDLLVAAALATDGASIVTTRPLWGMPTIAFSASLALATMLMEPATTDAAFGDRSAN